MSYAANTPSTAMRSSLKTSSGLRRCASLALAAGGAFCVSDAAQGAVQGTVIGEAQPVSVQVADTRCLAYDLAWSTRSDEAIAIVASQIAEQMTDPAAMYLISIPQLNRHWVPLETSDMGIVTTYESSFDSEGESRTSNTGGGMEVTPTYSFTSVDMFGDPIDRTRLLNGMRRYERDVDRALVSLIEELEELRPDSLVSIDGFMPVGDGQYASIAQACDFMVQDAEPPSTEAREFARLYELLQREGWTRNTHKIQKEINEAVITDSFDGEAFAYGLMVLFPTGEIDWTLLAPMELPDFDALALMEWTDEGLIQTGTDEQLVSADPGDTTTTGGGGTGDTDGSTDSGTDTVSGTNETDGTTDTTSGTDGTTGTSGGTGETDTQTSSEVRLVYPDSSAKAWPVVTSNGDSTVAGAGTKAIARWGSVPYQVFEGDTDEVSVLAFHRNGIEKIEFYVDGFLAATQTQGDNGEYIAGFDISTFPDGKHMLEAIIYPQHGRTRSLSGEYDILRTPKGSEWTGEYTLEFFTNANNGVEVQVVELAAGTYQWGGNETVIYNGIQKHKDRWLIYRPAPGVTRDQVIINTGVTTYPSGPWYRDIERVKLENVTIHGYAGMLNYFSADTDMFWFDNVRFVGPGMYVAESGPAAAPHQWWTNCDISDTRDGMARQFIRGCTFTNIGEDVMREANLVVDVTINNVDAGSTGWHSGVVANPILHDNRIYRNLVMENIGASKSWAFRNGTNDHWEHIDVAIVGCHAKTLNPDTVAMFCGATVENMLIRDSFFDGKFLWRTGDTIPDEWKFTPVSSEAVYITGASRSDGSYLYIPELYGVERID
ncbi:MAG: hypothetical protein ACYTF7_01075 [Planctomycetota bacterium]